MKSKRDAYFLERRLLDFLSRIKYYLCSSDRDIYFMIKQEIKYNPDLKGIRFCRKKLFITGWH